MNISLKHANRHKNGFTIVELLIVIVVIGILAAITVIAFNGVRSQAVNATLQSDLRNLATELMNTKTTSGALPTALASLNGGAGPKKSESTQFDYSVTGDAFCVSAQSTTDTKAKKYHFDSTENSVKEGGCPGPWSYVAAGWSQTCGVSKSLLYCWGRNDTSQLGDGTTANSATPRAVYTGGVLGGKTITSVAAGQSVTCAIASGRAYCWGADYTSAIGRPFWLPSDGFTRPKPVYINVNDPANPYGIPDAPVTSITAGQKHACAIVGGEAWCWGSNEGSNGVLGNDGTNDEYAGVKVATDTGLAGKTLVKVSGSDYHTCAFAQTSEIYCWGPNGSGESGDGTTNTTSKPRSVVMNGALSGKTVTDIAAGTSFTCAVASGKAYCWGYDGYASLGNGSAGSSLVPMAVDDTGVLAGKTVTSITAGASHACAVTSDGGVYCWGTPGANGTNDYSQSPHKVDLDSSLEGKKIQSVAAGRSHTCARTDDNWVYCWGLSNYGQLGQGSGEETAIVKTVAP